MNRLLGLSCLKAEPQTRSQRSGDVDACDLIHSRHLGGSASRCRQSSPSRPRCSAGASPPTLSAAPPLLLTVLRVCSVGVELDESVVMMANVALVVVLITLVLRERHRAPRAALPSLCPQRRPLTRPLMQCAAWARAAAAAELWTMRCWSGCRTAARRRSSTRCARARPRPPRPRACHYGSRS